MIIEFEWVLYVMCFFLEIVGRLFKIEINISLWSDPLVVYENSYDINILKYAYNTYLYTY